MQRHQEKPNVRLDRSLCIAGAALLLILVDWLVLGIYKDLDNTAPWRFIALVGALGLAGYLGWMAYAYGRVSYAVDGEALRISTALRTVEIPLTDLMNLYRWRQRWLWHGGALSELGVDQVLLEPNTLLRLRGIWVVVYRTPDEDRRAVGLLPSAKLLAVLKAAAWERKGAAG